jgi:amino acid adenylation domain-containing protein
MNATPMPVDNPVKVFARPSSGLQKMTPELIAVQARLNPERIALTMGSETITYGQLDGRAAALGARFHSLGVCPETVVALCLERSPRFVVAALAVLKCGAAYLPMDPSHPNDRLHFILADAAAALVVTEQAFAHRFAGLGPAVIDLDAEKIEDGPAFSHGTAKPSDLAYVIYTSGSTGEPKGVEITQGNLSNLIAWHVHAFDLDSSDRATCLAGVGFDAAVWEIWPHLAIGASLHLPDEETRLSAEALRDWLVAQRITISFVPTAIAEQLIGLPWPAETALRFLLTGADTLHRFPPAGLPFALVNNYGPTECTVVATSGIIAPDGKQDALPSIGRAIDNVCIHLLDEAGEEIPEGATGEIYIGGAGVARGYRNRRPLTSERFITDPAGNRLYRTGDLARRLPNGEIAFLGRADDQVKIRGYRIELGEINAVLRTQPGVQASLVVAREDAPGEKRLVAYVVPTADSKPDEQGLRSALRERLPDYMEPAAFVWLDRLPLNANGKIDRDALPVPTMPNGASDKDFVAPRTPVEETLAGIIAEVLKLPRVSADDDFFHLGAHSLLGAQIVERVRGAFGAELKLLDVFDAPTVIQLSVRIEEALTRKLRAMSEAEVEQALAALNEAEKSWQ